MADVSVLEVRLYGKSIGTLTHVGGDRTIFAFNEAYIDNPDRPTLGLAFKDEFGALLTDFCVYQKRVMPFFSNLLPEGHLRKYLAKNADVNPEREFHLLWALGHDLPGAVTIKPANGEPWPPIGSESTDASETEGDRRENALRFSLAGVQLKFSAVLAPTGGLTIPASGVGGSWIVNQTRRNLGCFSSESSRRGQGRPQRRRSRRDCFSPSTVGGRCCSVIYSFTISRGAPPQLTAQ